MLDRILGSKLRAKILAWLFTHPDERFFVRQLAGMLGEDPTNLGRELARLEGLGLLTCHRAGREKYYQANRSCPIFPELQGLIIKTSGVADVLKAGLAPLASRIAVAFVYGSIAEGAARADSDVDVMVVGNVSLKDVASALGTAQERLGREVNPAVFPPAEFRRKAAVGHHFLQTVLHGPKVFVLGTADDLAGLAKKRLAHARQGVGECP